MLHLHMIEIIRQESRIYDVVYGVTATSVRRKESGRHRRERERTREREGEIYERFVKYHSGARLMCVMVIEEKRE